MTDELTKISELIEKSSLGAPGTRALRSRTPAALAAAVRAAAETAASDEARDLTGPAQRRSGPQPCDQQAGGLDPGRVPAGGRMTESPSMMKSVEYIQDLLDERVEREIHRTETLTAIQNEILAAIKDVQSAIESLHSTYRSMHEESTGNVPADHSDLWRGAG